MEFGTFVEFHRREGRSQAQAFEESFAHVDAAEGLGLDTVWLAESHFNAERSVLAAPLVLASAIAARTERIKVGTAVQVLPLGNPLRIAEEAATLDHVSGGRFEFGVGRSGLPGSYEGYNLLYSESQERFAEYLEIILKAWTSERFSHEGRYFCFHDVCLVPKPLQSPHPPVRIAANSPETFPRLGKMGFPIFVGLRRATMTEVSGQVRSYEEAWERAGHEGRPSVVLRVPVYVAESEERAHTEPRESFMTQFQRLGRAVASSAVVPGADPRGDRAESGEQLAAMTWDDVLREEKVIVGAPETVAEQIRKVTDELGLSGVAAEFNAGDKLPRESIARSLRLFCEEVAPAFR